MSTETATQTSGIRKAAILLISLGAEASSKILSHLDPELVELLSREIATTDALDAETTHRVIEEFYFTVLAAHHTERGGIGYARTLLRKALLLFVCPRVNPFDD